MYLIQSSKVTKWTTPDLWTWASSLMEPSALYGANIQWYPGFSSKIGGVWGGGVGDKGEVEEVSEELGRGRTIGREGAKRKKTNDDDDDDNDDGTWKISKRKSTPKRGDKRCTKALYMYLLAHHMTWLGMTKLLRPEAKRGKKGEESGARGILEPVRQTSSTEARYYACPYEPCEETVVSIEGMRSHIKQVRTLYSYSCAYCPFMTKNFDSLKSHEKDCKGAYDLD